MVGASWVAEGALELGRERPRAEPMLGNAAWPRAERDEAGRGGIGRDEEAGTGGRSGDRSSEVQC
jgi:hypothetical protein